MKCEPGSAEGSAPWPPCPAAALTVCFLHHTVIVSFHFVKLCLFIKLLIDFNHSDLCSIPVPDV